MEPIRARLDLTFLSTKDNRLPFSTEFDHLFDHLSVSGRGVPQGSTDSSEGRNRLSKGVYRDLWGTEDTYVS